MNEDDGGSDEAIGNAAFVLALRERGVRDMGVLRAMEQVPRERFAPAALREHARRDIALPLPCGQSMTAPTVLGAMLAALDLRPGLSILEIGTGSGYATALLHRMGAARIRSVERFATLAEDARVALGEACSTCEIVLDDGLDASGPGDGRFERILLNGLVEDVPSHLTDRLEAAGRLVGVIATGQGPRLVTLRRDDAGDLAEEVGKPLRLAPLRHGRASVL